MLPVFDIKRYSINDGPGIRITIFFKGCPLSCVWCHNPEGISTEQTRLYTANRCIGCLECVRSCPQGALKMVRGRGIVVDGEKCILCGKCAEVCPSTATEMAVKLYSPEQLVQEIEKERPFFESSGGGVTFSGGEPLLQGEGLVELLEMCAGKYHRTVDTTLYASPALVERVACRCELFLVDMKVMDPEKHRRFCGVDNRPILENIRLLTRLGAAYRVRIPFIVGVNADDANVQATADFLSSIGAAPLVELLPYHDIAKGKHARLGTSYNPNSLEMSVPSDELLERAVGIFAQRGITARY